MTSRCCLLLVSLKLSPVITLSHISSFSFCNGGYIKHREGLRKRMINRKFIHKHIHSSIAHSKDIFPGERSVKQGTVPAGGPQKEAEQVRWQLLKALTCRKPAVSGGQVRMELPKPATGGDHLLARRLPCLVTSWHTLFVAAEVVSPTPCLLHSSIAIAMLAGVVRGSATALSHTTPAAPLAAACPRTSRRFWPTGGVPLGF